MHWNWIKRKKRSWKSRGYSGHYSIVNTLKILNLVRSPVLVQNFAVHSANIAASLIYLSAFKVRMAYRSKTERGQKAEQRLLADPYDTESWNVLLREAQVIVWTCHRWINLIMHPTPLGEDNTCTATLCHVSIASLIIQLTKNVILFKWP